MESSNFLLGALKDIARLFNESNIKYCLVGGLAVGILSGPRATEDIDLIVCAGLEEHGKIESIVKQAFAILQSKEPVNLSFGKLWRLILRQRNRDEIIILDMIMADNLELQHFIETAFVIELEGVPIPVISKENIIRMKSNSTRLKDRADIEALKSEAEG